MNTDKKPKKRKWYSFFTSLAFKVAAIIFVITAIFGSGLFHLTRRAVRNQTTNTYGDIAMHYAEAAKAVVTPEDIRIIATDEGDKTEEYQVVKERLQYLYDSTGDIIKYLCLFTIHFDADEPYLKTLYDFDHEEPYAFGEVVPLEGEYATESDSALADPDNKSAVGPVLYKGYWGWLISEYVPILDENNNVLCYIEIDINMTKAMIEVEKLEKIIIGVEFSLLAVIAIALYVDLVIFVIRPVKKLETLTENFSQSRIYEEHPACEIKSKDEFGSLYQAIHESQKLISIDRKALQAYADKVQKLAYRDPLTGVQSLNAYKNKTSELNKAIQNQNARFAIIMLDMNNLKKINDSYGHNYGDIALKAMAKAIAGCFIHSGIYRVGGDEFVAILEGQDYEDREELLNNIRRYESARDMTKAEPWNQVALSLGMVVYDPKRHHSVQDMLAEADARMYDEKKILNNHD